MRNIGTPIFPGCPPSRRSQLKKKLAPLNLKMEQLRQCFLEEANDGLETKKERLQAQLGRGYRKLDLWHVYFAIGAVPTGGTDATESELAFTALHRSMLREVLATHLSTRREAQLRLLLDSYTPTKRIGTILRYSSEAMRETIERALFLQALGRDDSDLIQRFKIASPAMQEIIFRALLERHYDLATRVALGQFHRFNAKRSSSQMLLKDVEDLARTVLYSLLRNVIDQFDATRGPLRHYLARITKNELTRVIHKSHGLKPAACRNAAKLYSAAEKIKLELEDDDYEPSDEELIKESGLSKRQVKNIRQRGILRPLLFSQLARASDGRPDADHDLICQIMDRDSANPAEELEHKEERQILDDAMGALSKTDREAEREIITDFYYKGMDHAQIAAKHNWTQGNSRVQLHRALEELKEEFFLRWEEPVVLRKIPTAA